jgi:uncharacterized RDD family membrane protein YckC
VTVGRGAGFGRRFAALIYDAFLLTAVLMIFTAAALAFTPGHLAISRETVGGWFYAYRVGELSLIGAYYAVNWVHSGQTLGMRAWRLRVVRDDGGTLKAADAVRRFICGFAAWPPAALGVLWLYLDPEHRALHDRLSHTRVVTLGR